MVDMVYSLTDLFFGISLLYYYTNLNSSIVCCLFSGDIYLSFGVSISLSTAFCGNIFFNAVPLKHLLFCKQFYYKLNHQFLLLFF